MNRTRRLMALALIMLVSAATSWWSPAPAHAAARAVGTITEYKSGGKAVPMPASAACQDVVVIGLRGSGVSASDHDGLGGQVWSAYQDWLLSMKGNVPGLTNYRVGYYPVDYEAASVWHLFSVNPAVFNTNTDFFASIDDGFRKELSFLDARIARCKNTPERYVLMGHSQGAMVIHRLILALQANKNSTVAKANPNDRVLSRISAVVAIADGDNVPTDNVNSYGTALVSTMEGISRWNQNLNPWLGAILAATYQPDGSIASDSRFKAASRYFSVCDSGDPVCDFGSIIHDVFGAHLPDLTHNGAAVIARMVYGAAKIHSAYANSDELFDAAQLSAILTLRDLQPKLAITGTPSPAVIGEPYSYSMTVTGAAGYALTWSATGLPPGLLIDASTGRIYGTPTTPSPGLTTITVRTTSGGGVAYATVRARASSNVAGHGWAQISPESPTCAVSATGGAWCWGANFDGQLGNGTTTDSTVPVQVSGLSSGVVSISAGDYSTCAVLDTGQVDCWGGNYDGALGNGSSADISTVPVQVSGISTATAVSVGGSHACAIVSSGQVKCWGWGVYDQLGRDGLQRSRIPVDVMNLGGSATKISAGDDHTCAVLTTGAARCWGYNFFGQLGDGYTSERSLPVTPTGLDHGVDSISASLANTCATLSTGTVSCWGNDQYGQLGDSATTTSLIPQQVPGLAGIAAVSLHAYTACTRSADPAVTVPTCWGSNLWGNVGNGTTNDSAPPTPVSVLPATLPTITASSSSCVLLSDGTLWCWGYNGDGQLGNGTTNPGWATATRVAVTP